MPAAKQLDPGASPLAFFGAELRHYRARAGMTQEQLGEQVNYSGALVGAVETGTRKPQLDFVQRCDEVLGTDRALMRLMVTLNGETFPGWFRPWLEIEREAHTLRSWEPLVVPGLLQTAEYARALLRTEPGATDEQVEELVAARLERQKVLDRDDPPMLWFVMAEGVLRYQIGSAEVMRDQLQALLRASQRPHVKIQIVPISVGAHPGVNGAFAIASFNGEPDVVYLESARAGQVTDRPEDVTAMMNIYDAIRAEALPISASLDLIAKVGEQWT